MLNIPQIDVQVKYKNVQKSKRYTITSSEDAAKAFREIFNADTIEWREEAIMLCLNRANEVVGFYKLSAGGMAGTVIDPKMVFTICLNCCASGLILAHNHPSGSLTTSAADRTLTQKIKSAGELLDIKLLDHIIMTSENFYSMLDNCEL